MIQDWQAWSITYTWWGCTGSQEQTGCTSCWFVLRRIPQESRRTSSRTTCTSASKYTNYNYKKKKLKKVIIFIQNRITKFNVNHFRYIKYGKRRIGVKLNSNPFDFYRLNFFSKFICLFNSRSEKE